MVNLRHQISQSRQIGSVMMIGRSYDFFLPGTQLTFQQSAAEDHRLGAGLASRDDIGNGTHTAGCLDSQGRGERMQMPVQLEVETTEHAVTFDIGT